MKKNKIYKCKATYTNREWIPILANSPEDAAERYAENYGPEVYTVSINGIGKFNIYEEYTYYAERI